MKDYAELERRLSIVAADYDYDDDTRRTAAEARAAISDLTKRIEGAKGKMALALPILTDLQSTIDKLDLGEQEPHVAELYRFTRESRTLALQVSKLLSRERASELRQDENGERVAEAGAEAEK